MVDMGMWRQDPLSKGGLTAPAAGSAIERHRSAPIGTPSTAESPCPQAHYFDSPHLVIMDIKEPVISVHCGTTVDRLYMLKSCHGG